MLTLEVTGNVVLILLGGKQKPNSFKYRMQDCPYLEEVIYVLLKITPIKRIRPHD